MSIDFPTVHIQCATAFHIMDDLMHSYGDDAYIYMSETMINNL